MLPCTPRPAPWKGRQFRAVDLQAVTASLEALAGSRIRHYVYLSVAQPAPLMRSYVAARQSAESSLRQAEAAYAGMAATFLRPWYVLGPGHLWPYALLPLYKLCERIPATREGALRLGLVTLPQMAQALAWAVENPPASIRILQVPDLRSINLSPVSPSPAPAGIRL